MDIGSLPIIILSLFTAILACVSVALLCHALKRNNEHVRVMLAELSKWNDARPFQAAMEPPVVNPVAGDHGVPPSAPRSTHQHKPDTSMLRRSPRVGARDTSPSPAPQAPVTARYEEPATQVIDPAADGTPVYIHSKSGVMASRASGIRNDVAIIPAHAVQPMYFPERQNDQPFTGTVVVIGVTAPGSQLARSLRQFVPTTGSERGIESITPDEFLLTYSANRRQRISLYELGQKLWEIQLHERSTASDFLVWTALEVNGQTLPEAIELARARLYEERKIRIWLASHSPVQTSGVVYISLLGRLLALRESNKVRSDEHPELVIMLAGAHENNPKA